MSRRSSGFSVHFDADKTTSGQRFYRDLHEALKGRAVPADAGARSVLFNVSAPIGALIRARRKGQRVVLRVDGLYFDRLSPAFLATFPSPLRWIFSLGQAVPAWHDSMAFLANLKERNYGPFARIALADFLIFQSDYARRIHRRYFASKPGEVIVNGTSITPPTARPQAGSTIRVATTWDDWRPTKRLHDLVRFVKWARESKGAPIELTILGYNGRMPPCDADNLRRTIESSPWIRTLPQFADYGSAVSNALLDAALYLTFTYRDSCPNVVIEAMGHGLPVVAMASGGLPDIVGDAGILLPADDDTYGYYAPARHECEFPPIDFDLALNAVREVHAHLDDYRARVVRRIESTLGIARIAERYAEVLERE